MKQFSNCISWVELNQVSRKAVLESHELQSIKSSLSPRKNTSYRVIFTQFHMQVKKAKEETTPAESRSLNNQVANSYKNNTFKLLTICDCPDLWRHQELSPSSIGIRRAGVTIQTTISSSRLLPSPRVKKKGAGVVAFKVKIFSSEL